ncbi:hypothetical protein LUZ60_003482 [Juncus effusus]|nr:hypothetical protein LUZ60_003482 [Juncus effusus]
MAGKSGLRDSLDFQGFLSKLDGWDDLMNEKNRNLNGQSGKSKELGSSSNNMKNHGDKNISKNAPERTLSYTYPSFSDEEVIPDANSEKELGNEYFKQKKYNEAIDCYSRSIALNPTAVAFANRAMAYLKLKKYEEAERDCTEALYLDDRYIKAYSRRSTARKELKKLKQAFEDAEFAVSLEPNTQELRRQFDDIKSLYLKEIGKNVSTQSKSPNSDIQKPSQKATITSVMGSDVKTPDSPLISVKDTSEPKDTTSKIIQTGTIERNNKTEIEDLASRAVSHFTSKNTKNIINIPKSAYEFEVSWKALSNDTLQQSHLLKMIEPSSLPQIFKNALSPSFLIDIVKCTATFFWEETYLAVNILDNLCKVPRFDMISMCIPPSDRTEMKRIWNEVFCGEGISTSQAETLTRLRPKYLHQ